jgi:hypothetical protein
MKSSGIVACFFSVIFTGQFSVHANDGRDRYEGSYPAEFYYFDSPVSELSGYRFLDHDMEGGADGDNRFRWARNTSVALIKILAFRTTKIFSISQFPPVIFDLSSENGDTPVAFEKGKKPSGRHPGGSHDGGINLDLGYYLTDMKGKYYSPDFSACTEHFIDEKNSEYKDAFMCKGTADRLDVEKQSFFFLELFKINRDLFQGDLLEEIGIDRMVYGEIIKQTGAWIKKKKYGASPELIKDMEKVFTFNPFEGWEAYHHHHTHIRLKNLDYYGRYREAFDVLLNEAKSQMIEQYRNIQPEKDVFLHASLMSYKMERALKLQIFSAQSDILKCSYRINNGEWIEGTDYYPDCMLVYDFRKGFFPKEESCNIEAKIVMKDGEEVNISRTILLPRQNHELFISVKESQIYGDGMCKKTSFSKITCWFQVFYPQVFNSYITDVTYNISRDQDNPEEIKASESENYKINIENQVKKIMSVSADITLSGRMHIRIPVYADTNIY